MCIAYDISLRKKVTVSLSVLVFALASIIVISPASAQISIPQILTVPQSVTLSVESADMSGTAFPGQWVEIWKDGILVDEGFSPFSVSINVDTPYDVFIYDDPNESKFFDHWDDDSTNPTRTVAIATDSTITAFFQTDSAQTVSLLVDSADMEGNAFEGMWVELWQNGAIVQEGFTPFSVEVDANTQYGVFVNDWEDITFDHWEDGSTNPTRQFAIASDSTFTAFFSTNSESQNSTLIANDDSATTDEDVPVTIDVMANDNLSGLFSVASVTEPLNGAATINADNTVTYLPNPDFFGSDFFEYTVSDSTGLVQDTATVFVTIHPVNDAPVAADDDVTTDEDTSVSFFAEANDSDVDGDEIFVASVEQGASGSAEIASNGTVVYTPNPDFNGRDSFAYVLSDVNGATDTGTISVTINPINDAPIAADDSAHTSINQSTTVDVLANDSDADGDSLNVTSTSMPSNGTATLNQNNTITYSPDQDFTGNDSFTYSISDGNGGTDSATVSVTVDRTIATISVNQSPIGIDVNPNTNTIYVTGRGHFTVISGSDNTVIRTTPSGFRFLACDVAVNNSTNLIYTLHCDNLNKSLKVFNATGNTSGGSIFIGENPRSVDVNHKTNTIYVALGCLPCDSHKIIDGNTHKIIATIPNSAGRAGVAVNPVTNMAYFSQSNGTVIVVDGSTHSVVDKISGVGGIGIDVNPITNMVYVVDWGDSSDEVTNSKLTVIDGATNTIVTDVLVGNLPRGVVVNEKTNMIYVANAGNDNVSVIDGKTNQVIETIPVGNSPRGIGVNTETNKVYVTNSESDTVTVLQGIER